MMKTLGDLIDEGIHVRREAVRVIVTPACAARALALNVGNRYLRKSKVEYLRNVIKANEWQNDHTQGISFSNTGRLIDGQHRLSAIARCDGPVLVRVDTGCPDKLQKHLDDGTPRDLADRSEFSDNTELNKRITEIIRAWVTVKSVATYRKPISVYEAAFKIWQPEVTWVAELFVANKGRAACKGTIRASLGAAFFEGLRRDRPVAVGLIQSTLFPDGDCQPGRVLREWLLRNPSRSGKEELMRGYRMAWAALEAAFANREVHRMHPLKRDIETIGYQLTLKGDAT